MRYLLTGLVLHFLFAFNLLGQVNWVKRAGGASTDLANSLWVDPAKNVYVTGSISDKAKFYKTEIESKGGGDIYVTKYNPAGLPLWIRTYGGKLDDFANAITGDPEGNLYITGVFTDSIWFENELLVSKGSDLFAAKINSNGQLVWARALGTSGTALPEAIAVTDQGGLYIGGLYSGSFDQKNTRQMGQTDGFITKLDWQGTPSWTKLVGGPGFDEVTMLSTDPWGRVVVGGIFDQVFFVDDQEFGGNSAKSSFALRLEATGRLLWSKVISGFDAQTQISDACTDLEGTVYLTGKFSGETQFGSEVEVSKGQTDIFLCAVKTDGQILWTSTLGGSEVEESLAIHFSADEKSILVAGFFNQFLESGRKTLKGDLTNQIFISRWDKRGNLDELRKEEFNSTFQCAGKELDGSGNLWVCGSFSGKTEFGKSPLVSSGDEDLFVAAISDRKVAR
jgi:hypothetical protein